MESSCCIYLFACQDFPGHQTHGKPFASARVVGEGEGDEKGGSPLVMHRQVQKPHGNQVNGQSAVASVQLAKSPEMFGVKVMIPTDWGLHHVWAECLQPQWSVSPPLSSLLFSTKSACVHSRPPEGLWTLYSHFPRV